MQIFRIHIDEFETLLCRGFTFLGGIPRPKKPLLEFRPKIFFHSTDPSIWAPIFPDQK